MSYLKTETEFYYSIGPENSTMVAPPSKKSTEHGLRMTRQFFFFKKRAYLIKLCCPVAICWPFAIRNIICLLQNSCSTKVTKLTTVYVSKSIVEGKVAMCYVTFHYNGNIKGEGDLWTNMKMPQH